MLATQPPTDSAQALHDHTHLRPLDAVLVALSETSCTWCRGALILLKLHLEAHGVPAFYDGRAGQ